jgi:hypothetical protein
MNPRNDVYGVGGADRGTPGFWIAAIASLWLVAGLVAVYLNAVSRAKG